MVSGLQRPSVYSESEVSIAVMGPTGSGKSTFINLVSGSQLRVSESLASCTQEVQKANEFMLDGHTVYLLDTPGFDDTDKSEVDILKVIAKFLENQYKMGAELHGVIYIHRVSDNRVGGASARSFRLFRKMCGDDALKNTIIVTTMWDKVTESEGSARENELRTDPRFFKPALEQQAKLLRHNGTLESAQDIIRKIFANHPIPLCIQVELVEERKHIADTEAGKEVGSELDQSTKAYKEEIKQLNSELKEVQKNGTAAEVAGLEEELEKLYAKLTKMQGDSDRLEEGYPGSKQNGCLKSFSQWIMYLYYRFLL